MCLLEMAIEKNLTEKCRLHACMRQRERKRGKIEVRNLRQMGKGRAWDRNKIEQVK